MECEFPSISAGREQIEAVFTKTKTIAVLGLSPKLEKDSYKVAKYLKEQGFKIIPVYPKKEEILGEKVYRSLAEIPLKVDMVLVFRKPEVLPHIVDAVLDRGDVDTLWTQIGIVHNQAAQRAQDAGLTVVQSLCAMVEHKSLA